tara:strand:- start:66 stop:230 length:165 start_codon:yes stop_codon:yes gene_type:complete
MIINSSEILVTLDGEIQLEKVDYDIVEGRVMFKVAPPAGSVIKVYKRKEKWQEK